MTLRTKLAASFSAVAVITLSVALLGYWQTQKLADALYEVGVVRLTSIQALDTLFEAKTALDASKRELLRESTVLLGDREVLAEELRRQQHSWKRAEKGWMLYEPLPKTPEEAALWQEFVPAWNAWRDSYEKTMDLLARGRATGDRALVDAARRENQDHLFEPARRSRELITGLVALNARVAAETKDRSIANARDTRRLRWIMLLAATASVAGAVGCGLIMGRVIGRPARRMAGAFSQIAEGRMDTQVPVESRDEFGEMAAAMNQMVESLRTSELRFRTVFENSIDAIGVSREGRLVLANPAFVALFAYAQEREVLGRDILEFIAPADHPLIRERRARRAAGQALPPMFEVSGRRANGDTFEMEVRAARFDLGGTPHVVAIHRDVTSRNRAAAQLRETAERLELALHTSELGVWRRHHATQVAHWDERVFAIFGLPPAPHAPTREALQAMVVPEDQDATARSFTRELAPGQIVQHRFRITRPDGQVRQLEVHWMVHGGTGQPSEWDVGVVGDITELVESTKLRERLAQAQKMEALGTLAAGVAHDFNNLLTSINGFIELAAASLPSAHEAAAFLQQARHGATSARELVRRILNFSRPSAAAARRVLDLGTLVNETAPLLAAGLPRQARLSLEIEPGTHAVLADPAQVQQVLMNLSTNGAHALGSHPGTIEISVRRLELIAGPGTPLPVGCSPGPHVRLAVRDTGSGMDPATLRRIFEPFFTTKKPGEGTGLGLAIVREIVATHDAGLEVTSVVGDGTTFAIFFPASAGATPEPPPATTTRATGAGERVLVVDDEPTITQLISIALRKTGYTPEVFSSPSAALERFTAAPDEFRLLIVDQLMPGLDGNEFIARVRQVTPTLPVIRMSGRFQISSAPVTADGATTLELKKPFPIAELLGRVAALTKP